MSDDGGDLSGNISRDVILEDQRVSIVKRGILGLAPKVGEGGPVSLFVVADVDEDVVQRGEDGPAVVERTEME